VAEAAGRIGERGGHRVQAVEPEGAARGVGAAVVIALAVRTLKVGALAVTVLAVLRAVVERLALRAGASMIGLTVGARWARAFQAHLLRLAALAVAGIVGPLLAVVVLAVVARRATRTTAGGRPATAVAVGVGRFHWRRVYAVGGRMDR
jgi:hypothetical protein